MCVALYWEICDIGLGCKTSIIVTFIDMLKLLVLTFFIRWCVEEELD